MGVPRGWPGGLQKRQGKQTVAAVSGHTKDTTILGPSGIRGGGSAVAPRGAGGAGGGKTISGRARCR